MGATTEDIFGTGSTAEPASPGTYGEQPRGYRLPHDTRLGPVRLQVADVARSLAFYEQTLGLAVLRADETTATLSARNDVRPLVELEARPGVTPANRRALLGLFHFAILLPDRASLARFVRHLGEAGVRAGAGDHLVSEAFYLTDPDGLGIEVYADRPRSTWRRDGRELMLATDPVDIAALLATAGESRWEGMPPGTVIGHVHLHVGNLATASDFYSEALGFDRMAWRYPGALFLAAGGYHHHLGTNTWAGANARKAGEGDARLLEWTIELPTPLDVAAAARSLARTGHEVEEIPGAARVRDPWGTGLRLKSFDG